MFTAIYIERYSPPIISNCIISDNFVGYDKENWGWGGGIFTRSWLDQPGQPNWHILCDLHHDDRIDLKDFSVLANDWLWQVEWYI